MTTGCCHTGERLADKTRQDIGGAAGCKTNDDVDSLGRIVLGREQRETLSEQGDNRASEPRITRTERDLLKERLNEFPRKLFEARQRGAGQGAVFLRSRGSASGYFEHRRRKDASKPKSVEREQAHQR